MTSGAIDICTVCKSPMMNAMFGDKKLEHDEMLGVVAARTYRPGEIITVYTGTDIGAVDGQLDAHKGYHKIAALDVGGAGNRGRHVLAVLMRMNETSRLMWRRLIDGYAGHTHAQHMNAAYHAPKGWHNKARLCDGGTVKVMEGCVIHEGEEILFAYGKGYWDRWGDDAGLKCTQVRQVATEEVQRGQGGEGGGEQGGGAQGGRDRRQGDGAGQDDGEGKDQDGGESGGADERQERERGEPSGSGDGEGSGERVVQRGDGLRVEAMSEKGRGKQRVQAMVAPGMKNKVRGRGKMPKGSKSVQWTAVAHEAYVQQQKRFERGEGGGVT